MMQALAMCFTAAGIALVLLGVGFLGVVGFSILKDSRRADGRAWGDTPLGSGDCDAEAHPASRNPQPAFRPEQL